ncbi:hypothetical protein K458DRAFT_421170 [Lentithecium fluviatile CBS 122367]|uniref:Chromo domain-containing protein n=1 Tax=Lentithecium fluviatile CBS 122367 TaxID=1168545 RepID=A0A6G1IRG7_9PLEO|nr:hypothetical protein K458DRAFT_421170 [Lentithecium fluviatile CBS 122367]
MPPALSDEEASASSGDEQIPAEKPTKASKAKAPVEEEDEEAEDDDEGEDEYVVEKIVGHKLQKGTIIYDVKWQGYDDPLDRTWEPESNLDGAKDVLNEYFEEIGGRPEAGKKRKGRKSAADASAAPVTNKRLKKEKEWSPPPGSWEHDVNYVDTVEEQRDPTTGKQARYAYLVWNNHKKTQHPLSHVYQKCPQKMLEYYESHLVFSTNDDDDVANGDETMRGTEDVY